MYRLFSWTCQLVRNGFLILFHFPPITHLSKKTCISSILRSLWFINFIEKNKFCPSREQLKWLTLIQLLFSPKYAYSICFFCVLETVFVNIGLWQVISSTTWSPIWIRQWIFSYEPTSLPGVNASFHLPLFALPNLSLFQCLHCLRWGFRK